MSLEPSIKQILSKIANTIRVLSMEAVQKADSGHPGMPMGCAEIGAYLFGYALRYNPKNPHWLNRDRLVLSAGHGSMWLYSGLHLSGYDLPMSELQHFRQLHSKTPGHPESRETPGVETTTGPLGQGFGNAVGMALAAKMAAARFNKENFPLFDNKIFTIAGDGCFMEGVSSEVSSLAGHLNLNNLIVIYDFNHVCLDGPISECQSENTKMRYEAYGWEVFTIDGNNLDELHKVIEPLRTKQDKPVLIIAQTIIGKGAPHKAGTSKVHGSPLGVEEVKATKEALGWPEEPFYVPQVVYDFFKERGIADQHQEDAWNHKLSHWSEHYPELRKTLDQMLKKSVPDHLEAKMHELPIAGPVGGRKASQDVLTYLSNFLPYLVGGSADLSCSDLTMMKQFPLISAGHFEGRNIKFGVREFGMATMATGIAESQLFLPFIGTFLTFSDYMRNAIRLCSLMRQHVIYQFTHDSIFLGEDGPTHQPIEHYATLRAIPHLQMIRPADANEVKMAWLAALCYQGPTALVLSRQNLPNLAETSVSYKEGMGKGAYFLLHEEGQRDYTLVATGSEVHLALEVARELQKMGKKVAVISMPCWKLFDLQPKTYQEKLFGSQMGQGVSIEAGVAQGWHKYVGKEGITISMEDFGASAPYRALAQEFGFTVESILERIL